MQFKIITHNNGVGIVTDAILLKELIYKNISESVEINFLGKHNIEPADIGIWIQNYEINLLNLYKKNIFFINEEWAGLHELSNLRLFDHVVCKSLYAKKLLTQYCDATYLPFISNDYCNNSVKKQNKMLHFVGKSIQKNTELVLNEFSQITLIDPDYRYNPTDNFFHIKTYQPTESLISILNEHSIHICCSLYESWGHYLYEGLSTGAEIICSDIPSFREHLDPDLVHFIPTTEKINLNYQYNLDNIDNKFPIRKSFYVDHYIYNEIIKNYSTINKKSNIEKRQSFFRSLICKNSKQLIYFFKNI